jgi:signal transduction histidine kinase/HAMP domain-containing protein
LGVLFLGLYKNQLTQERAEFSLRLNRMLQVSWESAMLRRDVDGLRELVAKLGKLDGIREVMILSPAGEVRFASDAGKLGQQLPQAAYAARPGLPASQFELSASGGEVLRSINPIPNQAPCQPCHGDANSRPVNGIAILDYEAAPIRESAFRSAALFMAAGAGVLALTLGTLWLLLRRHVISPLAALDAATRSLAADNLKIRAPVVEDNEIGRASANFNAMAERLGQQIALAGSQQRYLQNLLDSLPDGIRVIRAADMRVVLANRAFCQQLGKPAEAILNQPCYQHSHGREQPCIATLATCPLAELKQVGDTLRANHHHLRENGNLFHAEIHAALVEIDADGATERYVVESVRDLGQTARVSHEQRMSELGMLAAGIAHEIHNPLASVRLGVQGLKRELCGERATHEQIADYLTLIDQEIDNCIAVTRRLLLLARPPNNSLQLVELGNVLVDTLRLLEFDAETRQIRQQYALPETQLRVLADDAEVRMIFLNLFQNAHHAMPAGGTLTVRIAEADGWAVIDIADTGIGMAPEQVEYIFDPFYSRRADGVVGTGLGLTIVKDFVERMGGEISVESTLGQGSCFHIRLALAEAVLESGA